MWRATPHLNPASTVSEMKLTRTPALKSQASKPSPATITAMHAASTAWREGSPKSRGCREEPIRSEMADVTVTTECRELQKNHQTRPEKMQAYNPTCGGRPASVA